MKKSTYAAVQKIMIYILCLASFLVASGCSRKEVSEKKIAQDSTKVTDNDRPGSHLFDGMRTNDKKFHGVKLPDVH